MLHGHSLIVLLGWMTLMLPCFGFITKRSANVSPAWNIVPSLEADQKAIVDRSSSEKSQVTGIDKILQTSDTKKTTKPADQTIPWDDTREKKFDFILDNPRNIVLLLIFESGQDQENLWKDFKASHSFPVEGLIQSCHNSDTEATRFSLDSTLVSGNKDKECNCEHFLRSNIAALLFWARDIKGMTTGTLSNVNFTMPSVFGYEESVDVTKELDETDEKQRHLIDFGKPTTKHDSLALAQQKRFDVMDDPTWNAFDVFSRIRIALFRSMLESLGGTADETIIPSRRSHPLPSNLGDVVTELKSLPNEKGFILVAAAPATELNSAFELLQRELSQDTLLVVTGTCKQDSKPIPLFAQGPAAKLLYEATTICDLPTIIKNIMRVRRLDDVQLPILHLNVHSQDGPVFKRVPRVATEQSEPASDSKANATDSKTEEPKKVEDSSVKRETKQDKMENKTSEATGKTSTSQSNRFLTIFGTIASIVVAFSLTG
ncbi:uncharacterized protein LOC122404802 isoform X2 [Colletes gigas]|uniref:uncharacterized protein LOC122404802 isoform X2 n=1 Tax=Colletes gigas TaxID=935657 RepID=UPI001C9AB1B9|nr:uncharacterized protein LOC122404802 isoform X2 [Colletes gigas]